MASTKERERDWADDDEENDDAVGELPPPQSIQNKDGTRTDITYSFNDDGQVVKTLRRVRLVKRSETLNPRVAARQEWSKFGASKDDRPGPSSHTTSVGENTMLRLSLSWQRDEVDEKLDPDARLKDQLKDKTVHCRICSGAHYTARCEYKDIMPPIDEIAGAAGDAADGMGDDMDGGGGQGGGKKGSYVPPAMRAGADRDRMGSSKYGERDDFATLRVTNVSEMAEEQELRDMFERFGRVTRVFLAKDHATGMAKGFAFISFADRSDAAKACAKMDGYGFKHLILKVEFAKKPQ